LSRTTRYLEYVGVEVRSESAKAALVVLETGATKVLRLLEGEELARHDLVHLTIERIVVMLVLHTAPLAILRGSRQLDPPKLHCFDDAPPAIFQAEIEVGRREGGVAIGCDQRRIKTTQAVQNIVHSTQAARP
jgi:hypothetical protein